MLAPNLSDEQFERFLKKTRSPGFFRDISSPRGFASGTQTSPRGERSISAHIYPNGEFGVGFIPHGGISASDRRHERDYKYSQDNAYYAPDIIINDENPEGFEYTRTMVCPLPPKLGSGAELSQPRKRYGLKGITAHGRKMLRNAGHILDTVAKKGKGYMVQMGTLTIPSLSPERMKIIGARWNDITRRFFQECRRRYLRFGKIFDYASCSEIQPGRWEGSGEVGLHIHFLFVSFRLNKKMWSLPDSWVRTVWRRCLVRYVGEEGVPDNLNYRREAVSSSSAAYIAKYASKGTQFIEEVAGRMGQDCLPKQWWSMNSRLKKCIKAHTVSSRGSEAEVLLHICTHDLTDYLKYKRVAVLEVQNTDYAKLHNAPEAIVLGYGGMLSYAGKNLFEPEHFAASIREYMRLTVDSDIAN
jgi:hypothetical protein